MKLKKFLKAADSRISGGSDYLWSCFPDGQFIDVSNIDGKEVGGCIVSRKTQEVYQIEVSVEEDNVVYRWTSPDYIVEYGIEADRRKIDKFIAYDNVRYTDIDDDDEILDLVHRIVHMTYVHSHTPIEDEPVGLSPAAEWPFPKGGLPADPTESNRSGDSDSDAGDYIDIDDDEGFDYDACLAATGADDEASIPQTEFEVVLTVKHKLSVKASTMEGAVVKAKEFNKNFRNGHWPEGLVWEDQWVSKETVARRLETVNIED